MSCCDFCNYFNNYFTLCDSCIHYYYSFLELPPALAVYKSRNGRQAGSSHYSHVAFVFSMYVKLFKA